MSDTLKALDDLGELLDQLASNAREFDYNTANRMERDAAKALLAIEAAVNALPELLERVRRYESALQAIADNAAIDTDAPLFRAQAAGHARAALNQEPGQ